MLKGHAKFLVVTAAVLTASCLDFDDPLTVDPVSVDPAETDELMATASSTSQSASPPAPKTNFRARFGIDFSVAGSALVPNSPITVTVNGVANEDLASGTVEVTLPTQAEMAHAGAGKRPSYPQGQKFPVVARWQLPAMSAGDSWSRTVSIGSVEKGYYQIAATVTTERPANSTDSFVANDVSRQMWMLVNTGGGSVTAVFDGSVIPEGFAKVPGAFRAKGSSPVRTSGQTAAHGGGGSMAYSSSGYLWVNVVYLHKNTQHAAEGATVLANTIDNDGEEQGSEERTVPSSGYVRLSCPGSGQTLVGTVTLLSTSEVAGKSFNAFWDAHPNECGDTITAQGTAHTYMPWNHLKLAIPLIDSHFATNRSRMDFYSAPNEGEAEGGTVYQPGRDRIEFRGPYTYAQRWTAAHEYTHALHHESLGGLFNVDCAGHQVWFQSSYGCALSEGLADYGGTVGAPSEAHLYITVSDFDTAPSWGDQSPKTEGYVAMMIHDLLDSGSDGNDNTDYSGSYVFKVFKTCDVRVNGAWRDRDDVSDFIWCLEEGVDADKHEEHFDDITTPTDQREYATEPGNHDAEDIRDTWLQNLIG